LAAGRRIVALTLIGLAAFVLATGYVRIGFFGLAG
jgi:hypothetical protein